jgi:hypothetical protein
MSTDTIALFDITAEDATAERLLTVLTADSTFAAPLIDRYRSRWTVPAWSVDSMLPSGDSMLWGPGGFALRWRARTLELYHMMSFGTFSGDVWCRHALQQACHHIAVLVGSTQVLYTHELMPYEGADLREIAHWLHTHIGPPAVDFAELYAADYYGARAWYLEAMNQDGASDSIS